MQSLYNAGSLQGHWWGFINQNYVVWPIFFLVNVFIALRGTNFLSLFAFIAAGAVPILDHQVADLSADRGIWAATWQNQQCGCAPSNDSDQPGHPPSLIKVFAVRMKKAWVLSYPLSAKRRLFRLGWCPGWSKPSLGAHSFCWFCQAASQ